MKTGTMQGPPFSLAPGPTILTGVQRLHTSLWRARYDLAHRTQAVRGQSETRRILDLMGRLVGGGGRVTGGVTTSCPPSASAFLHGELRASAHMANAQDETRFKPKHPVT